MKDDFNIPLPRQEDSVAANMRRDKYSLTRDMQALEFNTAIVTRLLANEKNKSKCEKCGKEFEAGTKTEGPIICPDCK